jgi:hypothetical protein
MASRHWCFTLNNPKDQLNFEDVKWCKYAIWQKESAPDTGTEHYQGYVEFSKPVRMSALRTALPGAHYEVRRGSREQAREYCRKPDRIDGPWEFGTWSEVGQGKRSDLEAAITTLGRRNRPLDVAEDQPAVFVKFHRGLYELARVRFRPRRRVDLKVYCIWGTSGAGKSRYVWDMWGTEVYPLASQRPLWFDGYSGEKVLLIDEFQGVGEEGISRQNMLRILDIYPYMAPVKGGHVWAQWEKVYILSNSDLGYMFSYPPELKRRVTVVEQV